MAPNTEGWGEPTLTSQGVLSVPTSSDLALSSHGSKPGQTTRTAQCRADSAEPSLRLLGSEYSTSEGAKERPRANVLLLLERENHCSGLNTSI